MGHYEESIPLGDRCGENHSERDDALATELRGQTWWTDAAGRADDASEG